VGFQQIVEELHIELIVLHDQDGLGHPSKSSPAPAKSRRKRPEPTFQN
jgi:hypothetical protein